MSNLTKPKIIVVDDQEPNLLAFRVALRSLDCDVQTFSSGREALEAIQTDDIAVVLLDVQMPVMDGFETAGRIRHTDVGSRIPIVFLSAIDRDDAHSLAAYNIGAADFIYKPISAEILSAKLNFFITMFKTRKELEMKTILLTQSADEEKTQILENALDAVVATDEKNHVIFWNKNAEKIFGWSKEEVVGLDLTSMIVPERFRAGHRAGVRRFLETEVPKIQNRRIEISALRKNGEEFPIELTLSSLKSGSSYRFYSFMRDLTDERARTAKAEIANNELLVERQKLDVLIAESASAIGLMRGPELVFELANKKWTELVSPREYIGRKYADVYPELVGTAGHRSLLKIFETGEPFEANEMKLTVTSPAGILEDQYFDYKNVLIRDSNGKSYAVYCNAHNVTDRVLARNQLIERG